MILEHFCYCRFWVAISFFAFTESCCGHFVSEKEGLLRVEAKQTTILHDSFTSQTHVNRCSSECYLASCTIFQGKHHVRKTCPKYPCISEDLSKKSFRAQPSSYLFWSREFRAILEFYKCLHFHHHHRHTPILKKAWIHSKIAKICKNF